MTDQQMIVEEAKQQKVANEAPAKQTNSGAIPSLLLKYQLFPFHNEIIKNLSVHGNTIVFGSGNESAAIKVVKYELKDNTIVYKQIPLHKVANNRQNFIEWSPNGRFLALGSEKVSIWQYDGMYFSRYKDFSDELFEVTAFTWCPNSKRYAVSGINIDLSIYIRNVETEDKIKTLKNQHKVVGLGWDPYDKHLASLLASNEVVIYKCASWQKTRVVDLSLQPSSKCYSKRDDRKIDWSPDFRFLLVPGLEDRSIPLVFALDRTKQFSIRSIFMGPYSSINCIKFSPILYQYAGEVINIFATGDNDGNISVWGLGQRYCSTKPIVLLKSLKQENQLIEDIEWSLDGKILFASTFKRYLVTVVVDDSGFGRRIGSEEKRTYLQGIYGSVKSFASSHNQFKIFRYDQRNDNKPEQIVAPKVIEETQSKQPQQLVFTEQKVVKKLDGKKRIMPAMLVNKKQLEIVQSKMEQALAIREQAEFKQTQTLPQKELPLPKQIEIEKVQKEVPKPKVEPKVYLQQKLSLSLLEAQSTTTRLDSHHYCEVQSKLPQSILNIYYTNQTSKELLSSITISGKINYISFCKQKLLMVYSSQGFIYSFNTKGQAYDLPLFVGKIHLFRTNSNFDILILNCGCDLKVLNLKTNKLYVSTNIFQLIAANTIENKQAKVITSAIDSITLSDDCTVTIQFLNKKMFSWRDSLKMWCVVQNDTYEFIQDSVEGTVDPSQKFNQVHSREQLANNQFMANLLRPPPLSSVHQFEYNVIYYKKHRPDQIKYGKALLDYIKELVRQRQDNRLRNLLANHFIDCGHSDYMGNAIPGGLLHSIYEIKGGVIQEFKELYGQGLTFQAQSKLL